MTMPTTLCGLSLEKRVWLARFIQANRNLPDTKRVRRDAIPRKLNAKFRGTGFTLSKLLHLYTAHGGQDAFIEKTLAEEQRERARQASEAKAPAPLKAEPVAPAPTKGIERPPKAVPQAKPPTAPKKAPAEMPKPETPKLPETALAPVPSSVPQEAAEHPAPAPEPVRAKPVPPPAEARPAPVERLRDERPAGPPVRTMAATAAFAAPVPRGKDREPAFRYLHQKEVTEPLRDDIAAQMASWYHEKRPDFQSPAAYAAMRLNTRRTRADDPVVSASLVLDIVGDTKLNVRSFLLGRRPFVEAFSNPTTVADEIGERIVKFAHA
jgi:hypothetical protein